MFIVENTKATLSEGNPDYDLMGLSHNQLILLHDALILNIGRHAQFGILGGGINSVNLRAMLDILDHTHKYLKDDETKAILTSEIKTQNEGGFKQ